MSPLAKLHNLTLDTLYKMHCEKTDNSAIRRELERKHLPMMDDAQIALMRREFQEKELKFPRQMRAKRNRLKIKEHLF